MILVPPPVTTIQTPLHFISQSSSALTAHHSLGSASGLVVVRARFFRAERAEAREALLAVWARVVAK